MKICYKRFHSLVWAILVFGLFGCNDRKPDFKNELNTAATPWTSEPSSVNSDQFTFAVISDLNGEERPGIFEVAVEQLNLLRPQFVMSVGDLIDGGTEDTTKLKTQFDFVDERVKKAGSPFFHVGGNHDLTNMTMRKYWEKRYGKRYYHFIYNNVLFLILDTEDYPEKRFQEIYVARARAIELLDSGKQELAEQSAYYKMPERKFGEIGSEQAAYFQKVIQDNPNVKWTFLFMHKPVWQSGTDKNFEKIETSLASRKYSLFNGHLHAYSHSLRNDHDYIMLGTTGGAQNEDNENAFDHIMLVTFNDSPSIANLRLDGILDKFGKIPLQGDTLCFQASKCKK
jgi:hypothetical protein